MPHLRIKPSLFGTPYPLPFRTRNLHSPRRRSPRRAAQNRFVRRHGGWKNDFHKGFLPLARREGNDGQPDVFACESVQLHRKRRLGGFVLPLGFVPPEKLARGARHRHRRPFVRLKLLRHRVAATRRAAAARRRCENSN